MSKSTKRARARKVSSRPTTGSSPPSGTVSYERPELDHWTPAGTCNEFGDDRHIFDIYTNLAAAMPGEGVKAGALIATIVVNPALSPAARRQVAWLMSRAPKLWRGLRHACPHLLDDKSEPDAAMEAITTLWDAADHWPFEYLHPDKPEEQLMRDADAAGLARLPQGRIDAKAVKHV